MASHRTFKTRPSFLLDLHKWLCCSICQSAHPYYNRDLNISQKRPNNPSTHLPIYIPTYANISKIYTQLGLQSKFIISRSSWTTTAMTPRMTRTMSDGSTSTRRTPPAPPASRAYRRV